MGVDRPLFVGQLVVNPRHQQELLPEDRDCRQGLILDRGSHHGDVEIPLMDGLQQPGSAFLHHMDVDPRFVLVEPSDDAWQQERPQGGEDPDLELAGRPLGLLQGQGPDVVSQHQHFPGSLGDTLAHWGDLDASSRPDGQRHTELILESVDLGRQGRLTDAARPRRPTEVVFFG